MKKTIALLLVLVLLCTLSVSAFAYGGVDLGEGGGDNPTIGDDIDPGEGDDDIDPDGGDNPPSDNDGEDDDPAEPGPTDSDSTGELPDGSDPDGEPSISDLMARLNIWVKPTMKTNFVNRRLLDVLSGPTLTVEGTSAKFDLKSGHIEKTLLRDTIKDLMDTRGIKNFTFTLNKVENRISAEDLLNKMLDAGVSSIKTVADGDNLNLVGQKTTKQGIETVTVDTLQPSAAEDSPAPSAAEDSRAPSADAAKADTGKEEDADGNINVDEEGSKGAIISDSDQKAAVSADDDDDTVKDNELKITDDADDTVDVNVTGGADGGKVTVKDNEVKITDDADDGNVTGKDNDVNVTGNTPDGSATSGSATIGSATSGSGSSSRSSSGGSGIVNITDDADDGKAADDADDADDDEEPEEPVVEEPPLEEPPAEEPPVADPPAQDPPVGGSSNWKVPAGGKITVDGKVTADRKIMVGTRTYTVDKKNTVENVKPETQAAAKPDTDGSKTDINEQAFPHITIIENPDGSTTIVKPDISTENVTPDGNVVVNMDKL